MKTLYVLYDHTCGLCCRAVHRLVVEPHYISVRFIPAASMAAQDRFGSVLTGNPDQIVAVADTGEVYRGSSAWLMVLYSLKRYRALSIRLSRPAWRPFVDRAVGVIARRRHSISEMFGMTPDTALMVETRQAGASVGCDDGACSTGLRRLHDAKARAVQTAS